MHLSIAGKQIDLTMTPLQLAIVEKVGNDNGFEHPLNFDGKNVTLASALHTALARVSFLENGYLVRFEQAPSSLLPELRRSFEWLGTVDELYVKSEAELAALLRRAANLSKALPSQAANDYQSILETELAQLPESLLGTEVERVVRQRVGQNKYREAMLDYWGGACAVTAVPITEVLRASHAKPWAECETDAERLDVFNGFLLSANLDALFDRFLISFDVNGQILISPEIDECSLAALGICRDMKLRWVDAQHERYLKIHRMRLIRNNKEGTNE